VAHLTRPRGNRGELSAVPLTSHPERYAALATVHVGGEAYMVERVWYHKDQPIFKFRGVDSIGAAECLAGHDVSIPVSERFPLPEDEHYFADLMGCRVVDAATGNVAGIVTGWQELGGGPVVLELDEGRILVPYAKAILKKIDLDAREIRAELPEGLVNLNA
jgi:16S rRNA processing protein RimM